MGRVPPGRAGRLRLRHRLEVADRGADLLERKLHLLIEEQRRLERAARQAADDWRRAAREAERWLVRGLLLGGERALDAAAAGVGPAQVTVGRTATMGVQHPSGARCAVPDRPATAVAPGNTALLHAEAGYRRALWAAGECAALEAAVRLIGAEVLGTRRRMRALRRHWIPRLEEALAQASLALEQGEHEDAVRRRWAARAPTGRGRLDRGAP